MKDATPPAPPSQLLISFPALANAEATIKAQNVSMGQIYAAAWLLDAWARELRAGGIPENARALLVANGPLRPAPS